METIVRQGTWQGRFCGACRTWRSVFVVDYSDGTTSYKGRCADCDREAPVAKHGPIITHYADSISRY